MSMKAKSVLFLLLAASNQSFAAGVFETLAANCGKSFEGSVVRGPDDDPWRSAKLVMHVRDCGNTEIRIPLHYNDNHSRIWIISKTETGLRLKHDHRHADGSSDAVTMYGGDTAPGEGEPDDASVEFLVDTESLRVFRENARSRSTENIWGMKVEDSNFYYGLLQPELDFMVAFDLTKPVETPPPAWDKTTSDLQTILNNVRIRQEVPGVSAAVSRRGEVLFAGGSGLADIETGRAITADTALYAGSLTKVLTAVLTLNLVEQGKLSLDEIIPGIATTSDQLGNGITVSHLLTHASGLEREGNFGYWFSADFPAARALADYVQDTDLRSAPGTDFHYSNVGYATLGRIVEHAGGQRYDNALKNRVLEPLGMTSSGAPGPVADIAVGYSPVNRVIPSEERPFAGLGHRVGTRHVREYHDAKAMTPAFGAFTSARDLSLFAQFLLGYGDSTVLSDEMRARMLTAQESGWGLGIKLDRYKGRSVARHSGWFAAHRSHMLLDLRSGTSVVVLTNSDGASPGKIAETLIDSVLENL